MVAAWVLVALAALGALACLLAARRLARPGTGRGTGREGLRLPPSAPGRTPRGR
ncbi:hypothetical protein SAMN05660690_0683 [Geodermatophilus telluris]|uniref:Uncharacterized protein n=1 Tax=Geodermatophilus telluris TaxID=1190417 RepID=A0A1G6J8M4_9ACTN|nr:hypothetical protein [Geodermatophilus telluris]SDC14286.1 hypothetical protein SAMN05660690_0683 [Geodermatophilus telluris]